MPSAKDLGATPPTLVTSREPTTKVTSGDKTVGSQAFNDAVIIIAVAWLIIFALAFTLRKHNI